LIVISILVIDGVITSLPLYDLKSQRSNAILIFFGAEVVISSISQLVLLRIVSGEFRKSAYTVNFLKSANIIYTIVFILQCLIISLLVLIFLELVIFNEYNTAYLRIIVVLNISLSVGLITLLTIRFVQWTLHRPDHLTVSYTVATALMAANSLFLCVFMVVEMENVPDIITSSRMSIANSHVSNFELQNFQSTIGLLSYIAFWFASLLLLRKKIRNPRNIGFYILVTNHCCIT
jgi:hypothetical protein